MGKSIEGFLKKLIATFRIEADERIRKINSNLFLLEKQTSSANAKEYIEDIFREVHSLKGASRSVNLTDFEKICQSLENVFASLKSEKISISPSLIKLFFNASDLLSKLLAETTVDKKNSAGIHISELLKILEDVSMGKSEIDFQKQEVINSNDIPEFEANTEISETVRLSTTRVNKIFNQSEELITSTSFAKQQVDDLKSINTEILLFERQISSLFSSLISKIDHSTSDKNILNSFLTGFEKAGFDNSFKISEKIEQLKVSVKSIESSLNTLIKKSEANLYNLDANVNNLLDDVKDALMLPFSSLSDQLRNIVRNLCNEQGKEIEFQISGTSIEVDRRILDEMKVSLMHLLRNCVDHGIENSEERALKNKYSKGVITLSTSYKDENKFEILISDDGSGINLEKIKSVALKMGIVSKDDIGKIDENKLLAFIFQSGFSTSPFITDISGRGLGLAIVRNSVEKLNGSISIETKPDKGTTFRIVLPVKLATFTGILIRTNNQKFIFPVSFVERALRIEVADIFTIENKESISIQEDTVPIVRLNEMLELPGNNINKRISKYAYCVIINSDCNRMAFLVDEIENEQEILVRHFTKPLVKLKYFIGAALLGNDELVPIFNVQDLIKSASVRKSSYKDLTTDIPIEKSKSSVLLVEDSITARALLKNILETAGYLVTTAVDGVDAYTKLRENEFKIVVSDVEMPRMNGFDLTAKIRADKKLSEVPVVLVTALEKREDKEKGIDVGANAYIVKSSFEQNNLLEVISRFI